MTRGVRAVAVAVMLLVAAAGCTSDDSEPPPPGESAGHVALSVQSVKVPGVDEETRTRLESEVGDVLATYIVEGYLGDYPRDDFVRALADFTNGLADDGGRDLDGLTLAGLDGVTSVRATKLDARLSYFNPDGQAVGTTAFLDLAFEVTLEGGATQQVTRTGKLNLGRNGSNWQVTGYDVCCYDDAPVSVEPTS